MAGSSDGKFLAKTWALLTDKFLFQVCYCALWDPYHINFFFGSLHMLSQTTDSGPNNPTMAAAMNASLKNISQHEQKDYSWDSESMHVKCFAHKLALIVNNGLDALGINAVTGKSVQDLARGEFPLDNHLQTIPEESESEVIAADSGSTPLQPSISPDANEVESEHDELELNGNLTPSFFENIEDQPNVNLADHEGLPDADGRNLSQVFGSNPDFDPSLNLSSEDDHEHPIAPSATHRADIPNAPGPHPIPDRYARRQARREARLNAKAREAALSMTDRARARRLNGVLKKVQDDRLSPLSEA